MSDNIINNVPGFVYGTQSEYDKRSKQPQDIHFTSDTRKIFVGNKDFTRPCEVLTIDGNHDDGWYYTVQGPEDSVTITFDSESSNNIIYFQSPDGKYSAETSSFMGEVVTSYSFPLTLMENGTGYEYWDTGAQIYVKAYTTDPVSFIVERPQYADYSLINRAAAEAYNLADTKAFTKSSGNNSAELGDTATDASGNYAVAIGYNAKATKAGSFAKGQNVTVDGEGTLATVLGEDSTVSHRSAVVMGTHLKSSQGSQVTVGQYNTDNPDALFIVGVGSTEDSRTNGLEVTKKGVNAKALNVVEKITSENKLEVKGSSQLSSLDVQQTSILHNDVYVESTIVSNSDVISQGRYINKEVYTNAGGWTHTLTSEEVADNTTFVLQFPVGGVTQINIYSDASCSSRLWGPKTFDATTTSYELSKYNREEDAEGRDFSTAWYAGAFLDATFDNNSSTTRTVKKFQGARVSLRNVAESIPTKLPNPNKLTITQNGTTLGEYDGSEALTIDIPDSAENSDRTILVGPHYSLSDALQDAQYQLYYTLDAGDEKIHVESYGDIRTVYINDLEYEMYGVTPDFDTPAETTDYSVCTLPDSYATSVPDMKNNWVKGAQIRVISSSDPISYAYVFKEAAVVEVDSELSTTSTNPVQNKVVTQALNNKIDYPNKKEYSTGSGYTIEGITFNDINTKKIYAIFDLTNCTDANPDKLIEGSIYLDTLVDESQPNFYINFFNADFGNIVDITSVLRECYSNNGVEIIINHLEDVLGSINFTHNGDGTVKVVSAWSESEQSFTKSTSVPFTITYVDDETGEETQKVYNLVAVE